MSPRRSQNLSGALAAAAVLVLSSAAFGQAKAKTPTKTAPDAGAALDAGSVATAAPGPQACASFAANAERQSGPANDLDKDKGLEPFGKTAEERAELKDVWLTIQAFEDQSKEYRKEIQLLVERKYREKRDLLGASYERAISDLEVVQRQERIDAIAQFEEFLSRYPDERRYSPDVMYRLAELHYEKAQDDLSEAQRQYENTLRLVEQGKLAAAPPEPNIRYDRSIALYQQLVARFPDYRFNDGTLYLLGYCQEKQGDFELALGSYNTLIEKYPGSKFVPEAWVRIGEYYFDQSADDAIRKAVAAYAQAVAFKDHPYYDKALYKLGWAYYRIDDFDHAVDTFVKLLDVYQAKSRPGEEDVGGDLKAEALQYTSISFADEKWGSVEKAKAYFAKIGPRPFQAELFKRVGEVFFDQSKHLESIEALRVFLALQPLDKQAPLVQRKIIDAYERERDFDKASAERELLVQNFGPQSKWADANRRDPDTIRQAQELSEKSLYQSAAFHHQQAINHKQAGKLDLAFKEFQAAARGYGAYLERFPHSKLAYELTYYYAECLYNSFDFAAAAKQYVAVRDSNADNRYTQEAAEAAVFAFRKQMEADVKAGKLNDRPVIVSSQRKDGEKIDPIALEPVEKAYIDAVDAYLKNFAKCDRGPAFSHNAGVVFFTHNQFDEARKRFRNVISSYPDNAVSKLATNLIVETYLTSRDWKQVEDTSGELALGACKVDPKGETCVGLTKFKLAGRFKLADELMASGKFEDASAKYIQLVDEIQAQTKAGNQESVRDAAQFADKALNNAAVCLEQSRRFDSALQIYERLYQQYPQSPLADNALFRVGYNAEQSYDFDRAIERYSRLVKDYPTSKNRAPAMINQARLLEGDQRYKDAARAFQLYTDTFPDQEDAPAAQYHAAVIFERMKDYRGQIAALQEFQKRFSKDPKQSELIVEAHRKIADAHRVLGSEKAEQQSLEECVAEYKRRGMKSDNGIASNAAAEAQFRLSERDFEAFDKLKIGGKGKALETSVKTKLASLKKAAEAYNTVVPYKRIEWTLAGFYRKGFLLERLATSFVEAPIPPDVKRLGDEAIAAYQDQLGQQAAQFEDKAVEAYIVTLNEAKKARVLNNEWIRRTLESLNRFRPKEYPLLKEAKSSLVFDALHAPRLADEPSGPRFTPGASDAAPTSEKVNGDAK